MLTRYNAAPSRLTLLYSEQHHNAYEGNPGKQDAVLVLLNFVNKHTDDEACNPVFFHNRKPLSLRYQGFLHIYSLYSPVN